MKKNEIKIKKPFTKFKIDFSSLLYSKIILKLVKQAEISFVKFNIKNYK